MCADTRAGRVYYTPVMVATFKGEVFLSKSRMGEDLFYLIPPML